MTIAIGSANHFKWIWQCHYDWQNHTNVQNINKQMKGRHATHTIGYRLISKLLQICCKHYLYCRQDCTIYKLQRLRWKEELPHVRLATNAGTIILLPSQPYQVSTAHVETGTSRWHILLPDFQTSCSGLTTIPGYWLSSTCYGHQADIHCMGLSFF